MKKRYLLLAVWAMGTQAFAKPVSEQTAKIAGFNFLSGKIANEVLRTSNDLQLVYTAKSADAQSVNCYYVFNAQSAGFIMVSADDQVVPVLGYSNEGAFDPNNIPPNAVKWFEGYANQIKYVIDHNTPATEEIFTEWRVLVNGEKKTANKTTAVAPLVATKWNQSPYYNDACPTDLSTGKLSVTGCVATAMAQIMKFWNYPVTGTGSHSYNSNQGPLSANFGATNYNWAQMPNIVNATNSAAVAELMSHAGIAVEMNYSSTGSGAWVTKGFGPGGACAERAFNDYFGYPYAHGLHRDWEVNSTQEWVDSLKKELDAGRPFMYVGYTAINQGHVWVVDGYDNLDKFHVNWGWGGMADAYFEVDDLNPSSQGTGGGVGEFVDNHHVLIGLIPPSAVVITPDQYDIAGPNNVEADASALPVNFNGGFVANIKTDAANLHVASDKDFYKITLPAGSDYRLKARLQDAKGSNNGGTYTLDAKFTYKTATLWAGSVDEEMSSSINVAGGKTVVFRVEPFTSGDKGSYQLDITVTNVTTGVSEVVAAEKVSVYPNPASGKLFVEANGAKQISIIDVQGRIIRTVAASDDTTQISLDGIASGLYVVQIFTDKETITRKITIK